MYVPLIVWTRNQVAEAGNNKNDRWKKGGARCEEERREPVLMVSAVQYRALWKASNNSRQWDIYPDTIKNKTKWTGKQLNEIWEWDAGKQEGLKKSKVLKPSEVP